MIRNKMEARSILGRYHSDDAKMNNLVVYYLLLLLLLLSLPGYYFLLGYVRCKGKVGRVCEWKGKGVRWIHLGLPHGAIQG